MNSSNFLESFIQGKLVKFKAQGILGFRVWRCPILRVHYLDVMFARVTETYPYSRQPFCFEIPERGMVLIAANRASHPGEKPGMPAHGAMEDPSRLGIKPDPRICTAERTVAL